MSFIFPNILIASNLDVTNNQTGHIITTNKGDLVTDDGTKTARLGIGSDSYILTADSTETTGMKWINPAAVPVIGQTGPTGSTGPSNLQTAYNGDEIIVLNGTNNGIIIKDNATPITGKLFSVTNNSGSVDHLSVDNTGVTIDGKLTVTGLIDPTGLVLDQQSASPHAPAATEGLIWVSNTIPNRIKYTNNVRTKDLLQTFNEVLEEGNTTDGNDIVMSLGDSINGIGNIVLNPGGHVLVNGDQIITGNLTVSGTTTTASSENLAIANRYIYLNNCYDSNDPVDGGIVISRKTETANDVTTNVGFFAGNASVANPRVGTVSASTFAANDLVTICGTANNDGYYEVFSHSANILTVKGIGLTGIVESFTKNNFTTGTTGPTGAIYKTTFDIFKSNAAGEFYSGSGNTTPITYKRIFMDVTTTKGDIATRTTTGPTGLSVGANDTALIVDSSTPTGIKWAQIDHTILSNIGTNTHAQIDSHVAATSAHGITGNVVGTLDNQTLTNKTINASNNNISNLSHTTLTNIGTNTHAQIDSHITATSAHGITGNVVGTLDNQNLTNKIIDASNNTITNLSHTALTDKGTNTHAQIDSHIASTGAHGVVGNIVGTNSTQTLTGKTIDALSNSITNLSHINLTNIGTNTHAQIDSHIAATSAHGITGNVVGTLDNQTLTNKTINASNNNISNLSHTTLTNIGINTHAQIDSHIAATSAHGVTGNIVGTLDTQTLSNKNLIDGNTFVVDIIDPTKKINFDANSSTGTTLTLRSSNTSNRILIFPEPGLTDTLASKTSVDTFTNKTIIDNTNNVAANSLKTTGAVVTVSTAAPPSAGQVLMANSATAASWVPSVILPSASTLNALSKFSGTTGTMVSSGVICDASNNLTGINNLTCVGANIISSVSPTITLQKTSGGNGVVQGIDIYASQGRAGGASSAFRTVNDNTGSSDIVLYTAAPGASTTLSERIRVAADGTTTVSGSFVGITGAVIRGTRLGGNNPPSGGVYIGEGGIGDYAIELCSGTTGANSYIDFTRPGNVDFAGRIIYSHGTETMSINTVGSSLSTGSVISIVAGGATGTMLLASAGTSGTIILATNGVARATINSDGMTMANTSANRRVVLYENATGDNQFFGFGINSNTLRVQIPTTTSNVIYYAGTSPTTSNEIFRVVGTGGIQLPSPGGTGTTLNFHQDGSLAANWAGALNGNTQSGTIYFVRIGKIVQLTITPFQAVATSTFSIDLVPSGNYLPSQLRPVTQQSAPIFIRYNGSTNPTPGMVDILTSGQLSIWANCTRLGFISGGSNGVPYLQTITYTIV